MQPVSQFIPKEIFTKLLLPTNLQTIGRCERVCKSWAETIRSHNEFWQFLIRRDFKITPGKYICFCMPREEYIFLFQFMKTVLADGGTKIGQFFTPEKNKCYRFPRLCVDAQERVFLSGNLFIRNAKSKIDPFAPESELPQLPGAFVNSKNNYILLRTDANIYQFFDADMALITTITTVQNIKTFEVLEQGFLTGSEEGFIQLWGFNGDFIKDILEFDEWVYDLFTVQLCDEKLAILAWHQQSSSQSTGIYSPQVVSLFGLDGKKIEQTNLSELNNEFICMVQKIDEERFAIVLGEHTTKDAFIVSSTGDVSPLLLNAEVKDMVTDNGKVYMLVDDRPREAYECSIHVWGADGQYFGRTIRRADRIDVFNDKIYFRKAYDYAVDVYDLSFLPKDDKACYLDLSNFKLFPYQDKNQVYGIFYCLIKPSLRDGEDYFGCALHAFKGIYRFTERFNDAVRKEAITAHLSLNELNAAIAKQDAAGAIRCFDKLPGAVQNSLGWGIWIFEGMPMGNANFGPDFFHANPTHRSVSQSLQCFRENGWSVISYQIQQEIRGANEILNSPSLTWEATVHCLTALSPEACAILQKCVEVLENAPLKEESLLARYSSDAYKNGVDKGDALIRAINNIVDKI